jgi:nicotinate-nucleotide adenylyltransferase
MKVGLLFGSYNPVHIGHLLLATRMREHASLDEVWLVVSPHNPHKIFTDLADQNFRLNMAELAVKDHPFIRVCAIEFSLPLPSYTHQTLKELTNLYPENIFTIIIGEDLLEKLDAWREIDWIKSNYPLLVYQRSVEYHNTHPALQIIPLPLIDISATEIRNRLRQKKSIRFFVPEAVERFILQNNLYL